MSGIWAKSVLASEHSATGKRIDTMLCRIPKQLLAEFNTHRRMASPDSVGALPASSNAASSRAIPVSKIIQQVEEDPFIPVKWTKNEPGMQGYEELTGIDLNEAQYIWDAARYDAIGRAKALAKIGAHKQIVNRLLEPWMWAILCVTATEWDNFFKLRDHPAAEPHMQILAKAIWEARENAEVQILEPGQWHLPFITDQEKHTVGMEIEYLRILSVARCASTSYKTVDGFDMTLDRARKIYDSLLSDPLHASPFEHQAQADCLVSDDWNMGYMHEGEHRNFIGFRQLRAQIERQFDCASESDHDSHPADSAG